MALPKIDDPRFTYDDYLHWPDDERWELIDGIPYAMSPAPTISHQTMVLEIAKQIDNALAGLPCRALIAPVDVLLPNKNAPDETAHTVVQPDILVVCDPEKIGENAIVGAPDWIIEVLSPATARHDHLTKRNLYERAGVREYWLVHPVDRVMTRYYLTDGRFSPPSIVELAGESSPVIFPELKIDWASITEKLPQTEPAKHPSPRI